MNFVHGIKGNFRFYISRMDFLCYFNKYNTLFTEFLLFFGKLWNSGSISWLYMKHLVIFMQIAVFTNSTLYFIWKSDSKNPPTLCSQKSFSSLNISERSHKFTHTHWNFEWSDAWIWYILPFIWLFEFLLALFYTCKHKAPPYIFKIKDLLYTLLNEFD